MTSGFFSDFQTMGDQLMDIFDADYSRLIEVLREHRYEEVKVVPIVKKEVILILVILVFATATYAACDLTDTINEGSHITPVVEGKDYNISYTSYINSSAKFKVNGVSTSDLTLGTKHSFDDLSDLTFTGLTGSSGSSTAEICFNAGLSGKKGTCTSNTDCDDGNPCTINECDGDPLRCHRTLILWCRDDDGCCPESRCTPEKDNDCSESGESIDTSVNASINNSDTVNINLTNTTIIIECIPGDDTCPDNCTFPEDTDCDECSIDGDCIDNNTCTTDTCSGTPKKCSNEATGGCNLNEECLSIETRIEDKFCNKDSILELLRPKKEYCDNDYECISNKCKKNKCSGKNFFSWFKGLFSR